jgi:hypothetical protein
MSNSKISVPIIQNVSSSGVGFAGGSLVEKVCEEDSLALASWTDLELRR